MAIKKTARKSRASAPKAAAPRATVKAHNKQGHHLLAWFALWAMYACALVVSIAFLSRVDWKWLSAYAYEQTHQEEIAQEALVNALEKTTCEMAATATAASTSTCAALGFTATTTRSTTSTR